MIELALLLALARPDTPGTDEFFRFDEGDSVEVFDSLRFRVHFTRAGEHAVPLQDADANGAPDHVEQISEVYEEVLDCYTDTLGYRAPLADQGTNAANNDARFDVYLVDFGFSADGSFRAESCTGERCAGFMVQENDFAGYGYSSVTYANRLLASHELFHAVQAAYDSGQGAVLSEGTAVWASEQFDPSLDDLEGYGESYLLDTSRPLNSDGGAPVDPFTYGAAIFFEHLAQAHGDNIVRALWEGVAQVEGADWFDLLDDVIVQAGGTGFADDFTTFATSTLPETTAEPESLPLSKASHLVFISSWRTVAANPAGRSEVRVALAGAEEDLEGLVLVVAPDGETAEVVDGFDVTRPSVDAFFAVQVINTRQTGNGARPRLCVGDEQEVEACLAKDNPPQVDAGPDADVPPTTCACASADARSLAGAGGTVALLPLLAVLLRHAPRRGRTRAHAAT